MKFTKTENKFNLEKRCELDVKFMKTENKQFRKKIWTRREHQYKYGILRKLMEQECPQHTTPYNWYIPTEFGEKTPKTFP